MANTLQLKNDIKKLKLGLKSKGLSASIKDKLKNQLKKAENELKSVQAGAAPRKVSTTKSTKATLESLKKLVEKKKYGVYKNAGVDLKKDAQEGAMATGRRTSKGLKSNQYGSKKENKGNVYYEYRANRLDVKQPKGKQKYPKLEDGGMMAKGGETIREYTITPIIPYGVKGMVTIDFGNRERFIGTKDEAIARAKEMAISNPNIVKVEVKNPQRSKNNVIAMIDGSNKEYADGGMMAKGGELEYDSILSVLKEKIEDSIDELPRDYEMASEFQGEEVEHESRDGFIPYTDGGYEARWFEHISHLQGAGYSLPTAGLDAEMQRQVDYNYEAAKDRFKDEYPDIVEELGEDNIDYNSLYDAGYESEAEELSEWEMDYDGDDTIMMEIGAFYYSPENSRGKDGKHTMFVFGNVNLESPYHRSGNLEDGVDSTFTFNSIDELKKKMDESLKKVIDWFEGKHYKEGKKDLKVTRMAKGGKTKDEPKIVRGYFEDEAYEYADGGEVKVGDKFYDRKFKQNLEIIKKMDDSDAYYVKWEDGKEIPYSKKNINFFIAKKLWSKKGYGSKMADGGVTEKEVVDSNAQMILSQIKSVKHHADELSNIVTKKSDIEAWVVAKIERASTDLSDITHYLDGQHEKMSMGGSVYHYAHKMDKK